VLIGQVTDLSARNAREGPWLPCADDPDGDGSGDGSDDGNSGGGGGGVHEAAAAATAASSASAFCNSEAAGAAVWRPALQLEGSWGAKVTAAVRAVQGLLLTGAPLWPVDRTATRAVVARRLWDSGGGGSESCAAGALSPALPPPPPPPPFPTKVLVFSRWEDMLDILEVALAANGVVTWRPKGGGAKAVDAAVCAFRADKRPCCLLLSVRRAPPLPLPASARS